MRNDFIKWPVVKLEELATSVDYGLTASAIEEDCGPKFLRITDIQDGSVNWETVPYCRCDENDVKRFGLASGDIVFARTGATTGKSYLIRKCPDNSVFASYLIRVRPKPSIDSGYLFHFFQTPEYWRQVAKHSTGTAQAGVNASRLKDIRIPLPSLPEQHRIAAILDKAVAIRELRRQAIAKLNTLLKAVFLEMFGDPVRNSKGFPKIPLGELIKVKSGEFLPEKNFGENGHFPVYGGNGISGYHDQFMFETPMIVIGRVGYYCGAVHVTAPRAWITDNALYVAGKSDKLTDAYLAAALINAKLNRYAGKSAQPLISGSRIYPIPILVPPLELQDKYRIILQAIECLKFKATEIEKKISELFSSLQQRAFSGKLFTEKAAAAAQQELFAD
jgi:type I restriction enzyme S subunit